MRRLRVDSPSIGSVFLLLAAGLAACCGSSGGGPTDPGGGSGAELGPVPVALSPIDNAQVTTDTPAFTVRNARGFDRNQAQYFFEVVTQGTGTAVASASVPAGTTTTVATIVVPRGMNLAWRATAQGAGGQVASALAAPNAKNSRQMASRGSDPA